MRRTMLVAVSAVLLSSLGACSDGDEAGSAEPLAVEATASTAPTSADPYAWTDVSYEEYLAAAKELRLHPDVLLPLAGFSSGLNALCHATAEELVAMRTAQMDHTKETETYSTAKYLGDEVALRLGLACPQRMADWNSAGREREHEDRDVDNGVSAVSDAELADALAEEATASNEPEFAEGSYGSSSADDTSADDTSADDTSDTSDGDEH